MNQASEAMRPSPIGVRPRGASSRTVATMVAAVTLTACSSNLAAVDEQVSAEQRAMVQQVLDEPMLGDPGPDVGGLTRQRQMLEDFDVTWAEYEEAVRTTLGCVRDEGFEVIGPSTYPELYSYNVGSDPRLTYMWLFPSDSVDGAVRDVISERCRMQWSWWIETVWMHQNRPTAHDIEEARRRAADCARRLGIHVSNPPTDDDVDHLVAAGCRPWEADA